MSSFHGSGFRDIYKSRRIKPDHLRRETADVPGALTQGATLEEARENLADAVRMIREPVDLSKLPKGKVVIEELEV